MITKKSSLLFSILNVKQVAYIALMYLFRE